MNDNSKFPQRKNIRADFHDYSGGDYFVTICTQDKKHYFGEITDGQMHLSKIGEYATLALENLAAHYPYVEVPLFVVMPNHVHAIVVIRGNADDTIHLPAKRTALSVVIGGYKQVVTQFARRNNMEFGWQFRFHDHIIRSFYDGNKIANYIQTNVIRWDSDCYHT